MRLLRFAARLRFVGPLGLVGMALPFFATTALALDLGQHVDNFRLLDHRGIAHELYYLSDMKAVVLLAQQNDCKHSDAAIPKLETLRQQYAQRGVEVLMLNSTAGQTVSSTISIPVLMDPLQLIGESLDTERAGEALVINTKDWTLAYRGPIGYAAEAIDATLSGTPIKKAERRVKGCKIKLAENDRQRAHRKISYEHTIAPMLIGNCVTCHRAGGIGPWAMTNYDMVRGFAPMIREVLRTQRMPPWHADPHYGVFSNDRSLTVDETKTLVHWIEAGAPRDKKAADPLTAYAKTWPTWSLGEPDLVVEIPAFNVPATGTIPYQRPVVKNPLGRDVWLRAIEFAPTDRSVVHHILAGTTGASGDALSRLEATTSLGVYVPGDVPQPVPKNTGVFISKDADFVFQMHYTASGKAVSEVTKVGLYFSKEVPTYPLRNTVLLDPRLKIPAHTKNHQASVSRTFQRDTLIYTLMAHSHVRGKSARFEATYPDGKTEILLSVPHYDFNWQTSYALATPKLLPKGTKLVYYSGYDNSVQNKSNPDPNIEVRWGEQTWEEMIYGDVRFRYVDEVNDSDKVSKAE